MLLSLIARPSQCSRNLHPRAQENSLRGKSVRLASVVLRRLLGHFKVSFFKWGEGMGPNFNESLNYVLKNILIPETCLSDVCFC